MLAQWARDARGAAIYVGPFRKWDRPNRSDVAGDLKMMQFAS